MKKILLFSISIMLMMLTQKQHAAWDSNIMIYKSEPNESVDTALYYQNMANTADARLAALKENRLKHKQLDSDFYAGKYTGKNEKYLNQSYEHISQQEQKKLDGPALNYFKKFWFLDQNTDIKNPENLKTENKADQLFKDNRYEIKENYRLAQKAADASSFRNNVQNVTIDSINLGLNPGLTNTFKVGQTMYNAVKQKSPSQYTVDNVTYNAQYNPELKQIEVRRGVFVQQPQQKSFNTDAEYAQELIEHAKNIKDNEEKFKYNQSIALQKQLNKENTILANQTIPNQSKIIDTKFMIKAATVSLPYLYDQKPSSTPIIPKQFTPYLKPYIGDPAANFVTN